MTTLLSKESISSFLEPFISLSYPTSPPAVPDSFPESPYYETGPKDVLFMVSCIAVMAILRDITRIYLFEPFARWKLMRDLGKQSSKLNGHVNGYAKPSKKDLRKVNHGIVRFAEQGWGLLYYTVQWFHGYYINTRLPNGLIDHRSVWEGYPHIPLAGPLKFYYLTQTAFYTHQILILNAEAPRKDHFQMMAHHIITVFLMGLSYFFNFTRVGCIIMVLMDSCDIFLPLAKMMKYVNIPHQIYDYVFGIFLLTWLATRHVFFVFIIKSALFDSPDLVGFEWSPKTGKFYTREYYIAFTGSLIALQIIQIVWFLTICRVAYNVLMKGEEASDVRSDEEGELDDDVEDEKKDQ